MSTYVILGCVKCQEACCAGTLAGKHVGGSRFLHLFIAEHYDHAALKFYDDRGDDFPVSIEAIVDPNGEGAPGWLFWTEQNAEELWRRRCGAGCAEDSLEAAP